MKIDDSNYRKYTVKNTAKTIVKTGKNIDVKILCLMLIKSSSEESVKKALSDSDLLVS